MNQMHYCVSGAWRLSLSLCLVPEARQHRRRIHTFQHDQSGQQRSLGFFSNKRNKREFCETVLGFRGRRQTRWAACQDNNAGSEIESSLFMTWSCLSQSRVLGHRCSRGLLAQPVKSYKTSNDEEIQQTGHVNHRQLMWCKERKKERKTYLLLKI